MYWLQYISHYESCEINDNKKNINSLFWKKTKAYIIGDIYMHRNQYIIYYGL